MKSDGRLAVSVMMLAIFAFFVGQALAFQPEARFMPLLVGIPAILLCLLQIAIDLRKRGKAVTESAALFVKERPVAMWLVAFFLAIVGFGFTYGAPPMVAAYLYFAARERLLVAFAGGVFSIVVLSFAFERLLKVPLFEGLITTFLS